MSHTIVHEAPFAPAAGDAPARASVRPAARLLSRAIFASLLALVALTAAPYGAAEAWWAAAFECAVFVLTALWAVEGALGGRWLVRQHVLLVPVLALAAFALLQTSPLPGFGPAVSRDPFETRLAAFRLLSLGLAGGLLLRFTDSERRLRALAHTLVAVGAASALFGVVRLTSQRDAAGFILPHLMPNDGFGQFVNRNHFAFLAEMSAGLLLGLLLWKGAAGRRAPLYAGLALLVWAALVLSNSRGGLLAMLCQVIFLGLTFGLARRGQSARDAEGGRGAGARWRRAGAHALRFLLLAALLAAVTAGAVWVGGQPLVTRLESVGGEFGSRDAGARTNVSRADIWRSTWRLIRDNPVAGVGFGGYWTAITRYHDGSGEAVPQQAHNDYLELLASGGAVGGALALWLAVLVVRLARRRLRAGAPFARAAALGALAGMFGVAVHSLVDFGLHLPANALFFTALVVIATAAPAAPAGAGGREARRG